MFRTHQAASFLGVADGSSQRDFEMPVEDENPILNHRGWPQILELLVGIQRARSKLKSRKIAGADQQRPVDGQRRIRCLTHPERVGCWQRFAGNSIVAVINDTLGEVDKPAILHAALVEIFLRSL